MAVVAPTAMDTEPGTGSAAGLPLIRLTTKPPASAALLSVAVQVVDAPELNVEGAQAIALSVTGATGATSVRAVVCGTPFQLAVICAEAVAETTAALAVNVAAIDPAVTSTDGGVVRLALLLPKVTVAPPAGASWDRVTVQVAVPGVLRLDGLHDTLLSVAVPPPVPELNERLIVLRLPRMSFTFTVSWPARLVSGVERDNVQTWSPVS